MTIALDIGASRIRSLRPQGTRLFGRAAPLTYALLPDSPRHRRLLDGGRVPFAVSEDRLVLIADHAVEFARLFREPIRSGLCAGQLAANDPLARQVVAAITDAVLPRASEPGEICCLTVPGGVDPDSHEAAFFARLVRLAGYTPAIVRAGLGLILAELRDAFFTGVGLSFGAATSELTIAHRGRQVASLAIGRGGNWIDAQLAEQEGCFLWDGTGQRHPDLDAVARAKTEHGESLLAPTSPRGRRLAALYQRLIDELCQHAAGILQQIPLMGMLPRPLPLVVGGGTARIRGFGEMLDASLQSAALPIALRPARLIYETDYTVARGCLIRAELEADAGDEPLRAAA